MLDGSSIASILGAGAIGLGFLLAYLTYRLLRQERTNYTPLYVFQVFCFALVIVGAVLQYFGNAYSNKIEALEASLKNSHQTMTRIASMVPEAIQDLEAVNQVLTGNVCSGGSSGIPIWGGKGTQAAARSTRVIGNLAAAKSAIDNILEQK